MFLSRLSLEILACADERGVELEGLKKQANLSQQSEEGTENPQKEDERRMLGYMINVMRNKEFLLILDNCEDPLADDWSQFVHLLDNFLEECPRMKILVTSRKYINRLEHNVETPYHLYSLNFQTSIKLLLENVKRKISNEEIQDLLQYKIPDDHPVQQQFPIMNTKKATLSNHPFTLMLGGHPQAIALAAPILELQSLKELFIQLLDSNVMDALDYSEQQSYASLRMSLEVSIKNLQKTCPESLDLFKFIGLLPAGIDQSELDECWGDKNWIRLKVQLIKASMIVYKQSENMLTMLPFMNIRAMELLEQDKAKKDKFHLK